MIFQTLKTAPFEGRKEGGGRKVRGKRPAVPSVRRKGRKEEGNLAERNRENGTGKTGKVWRGKGNEEGREEMVPA
jgi:hypothetical protein